MTLDTRPKHRWDRRIDKLEQFGSRAQMQARIAGLELENFRLVQRVESLGEQLRASAARERALIRRLQGNAEVT